MTRSYPKSFTVGETVHLTSRVSVFGTMTPTDPDTVALTSLRRSETEILDAPVPFDRSAMGQYELVLTTADLDPGTYTLVVTHADGPEKVSMVSDGFVLRAP